MINEKENEVYEKLKFIKDKNQWVHFNNKQKQFFNGKILELKKDEKILFLKERVLGTKIFSFSEIVPETIRIFKKNLN